MNTASSRYPWKGESWAKYRVFRSFVVAALVIGLTAGFALGAGMLVANATGVTRGFWWLTDAQSHGVAQLFGWAGLFTMGVAYHVVPRFRNTPPPFPWPQRASLVLVVAAILLQFAGLAASTSGLAAILLLGSGLCLTGGMSIFAGVMLLVLRRGQSPAGSVERWIWAGALWSVAASAIHLLASIDMAVTHAPLAPALWNDALTYAALFGFLGSFIFGVSERAVRGFMRLRPGHVRIGLAAFVSFQLGIAWYTVAQLLEWPARDAGPGAGLIALGAVAFVAALRVLEPSASARSYPPGAYGRYEYFVRAAYFWLVVGATLFALQAAGWVFHPLLPSQDAAPILHTFALGFVTMMIFGMAARMLPLFEGSEMPAHWCLDAALLSLNLSVATRIAFGLSTTAANTFGLALSGTLGLAALAFFAWPAIASIREPARARYRARSAQIVELAVAKRSLGARRAASLSSSEPAR